MYNESVPMKTVSSVKSRTIAILASALFCLLGPSLVLAAQNSTAAQQPPQSAPPLPAPNQTSGQQQDSDQGTQLTLKANVNEVDLVFTVTDRHGHFIKDLKESDFALLDDQKAPAQVYSFTQETNLPLRVGILIDTSTSIRQRFQLDRKSVV